MTPLLRLTARELALSIAAAIAVFIPLGTVAALWENPLFMRMTPTSGFEISLLIAQAGLAGLYLGTRQPACAVRTASVGGVLGFLGVACPVCNKLFVLAFGSAFLLEYFEPLRLYVGLAGTALLLYALYVKLFRNACVMRDPPHTASNAAHSGH